MLFSYINNIIVFSPPESANHDLNGVPIEQVNNSSADAQSYVKLLNIDQNEMNISEYQVGIL